MKKYFLILCIFFMRLYAFAQTDNWARTGRKTALIQNLPESKDEKSITNDPGSRNNSIPMDNWQKTSIPRSIARKNNPVITKSYLQDTIPKNNAEESDNQNSSSKGAIRHRKNSEKK